MDASRALCLTAAALSYLFSGAGLAFADIHLASTQSGSYEGRAIGRTIAQEEWSCADKEWRKTDGRVRITRRDLGVSWSIDPKAGTYTETPLGKAAAPAPPVAEKLHNDGYEYDPEFDWKLEDKGFEEAGGVRCHKYVLDGDADLSEKVFELWVADDLGPAVQRDDRTIALFRARTGAGDLLDRWEALKGRFVLRERVTEDRPIGGDVVTETVFTTFEAVKPPDGIYDLPAGLKKVEPGEER